MEWNELLSMAKRQELVELVKEANGKVILLVHPYYDSQADEIYWKSLNKILSQNKTPVIILEADQKIHELKDQLLTRQAKCFILPTFSASHILRFGSNFDIKQKDLAEFLTEIGAKKVFVGGQVFLHAPLTKKSMFSPKMWATILRNYKNERVLHKRNPSKGIKWVSCGGCVGQTYSNLIEQGHKPRILSRTVHQDRPHYWSPKSRK
jgi:hypothetical protein